ncbi:hypothetical protein PYW08_011752 [Mythimna loreyi]|uniref:Uncharacterized protein n=1 Tax=Mythimna loreyi TaxID=667449 RepID=A0ACC2QLF1_9NEOP|nr:hypothetical protein PYW08_011752 [Mythimna loreyi]
MKILISFLCFLTLWCSVNAKCVARGECYVMEAGAKPCAVEPPAEAELLIKNLTAAEAAETIATFSRICPTLVLDEEGNRLPDDQIFTCCDRNQIERTASSLLLAEGILGRCPTCYRNFARQICEMNCATDQDRFLEVKTAVTDNIEHVDEMTYRVHQDFMLGAHASCAGVMVPQTGLPAINMMCGGARICDAQAWFSATGDAANNPLVPVQVNFIMSTDKDESMNKPALPCNETFGDDLPCSCVDCLQTCPDAEPEVPEVCTVGSINCIGFYVGLGVFICTVPIFILLAYVERRKANSNSGTKDSGSGANKVTKLFQVLFAKLGGISGSHPVLIIMITSWVTFAMFFGVVNLNLTTNPVELWSAPTSRSRLELNFFNERFGPFYRTAQVFLTFNLDTFKNEEGVIYGPAFRIEALQELIKLEDAIFKIGKDDGGVTLKDVCYAPLRQRGEEKDVEQCVSMSASSYLPDRIINNNTYLESIQNCINNHYGFGCLSSWGGGAEPDLVFGGFDRGNIFSANTLLLNFPIANFLLQEDLEPALEWEQKFIDLLHDYRDNKREDLKRPDFVTVNFATERSIEDEIQRVSVAEAVPIAISYVLMFIYVTLALGNIRSLKTWLIDSKIMVALGSIVIVLVAIFCAMGALGYANVTLTLLAINVIPFFILSVGIDNVFLMVNTLHDVQSNLKSYDDYREDFSFEKKRRFVFEKMMGTVGPSMLVSSVTQITCFAIGSIANFPAVVTFAIFASVSLGFLFVFQVTTVVALLSIDYKRASNNRLDLFCCIQKKILDDENPLHSETPYKGVTQRLMEPYSKFLLDWRVKIVVVILFMAMISASIMLVPQIEVGLDQELALPPDSYVYQYLQAVSNLIRMGPPIYFVVKGGLDYTNPEHQNVICGGQLCHTDSLITQIFLASQYSDITSISKSSNSWLDDFIDWTNLYGACCQYDINGEFCPSQTVSPNCTSCEIARSDYANGLLRPHQEAFEKYIPFFLWDPPTEMCSKAGLASYSSAVNYVLDANGRATVHDTNFMAYLTPLSTSKDYINAVDYGYRIAADITEAIQRHTGVNVEVFPYSLFFIYYEQYLTMWADTFASIGYCLIGAMVFNLLASGFNILTTFAVMINVILVVVNMMGVMYIWNIPLNAVSCVNLIVSIGISVEFCSHIAYAYAIGEGSNKVEDAIQKVGATIITGITFTNIPVIVLAFSYTEIIEVFFFRMFFSLVILSLLHGMIFFPVLLSYLDSLKRK